MNLTRHASKRASQRGVPSVVIAAMLVIGKRDFDGRGGCRVYLDKNAQKKFAAAFGNPSLEKYASLYLVTAANEGARDTVITVAWRH